MTTKNFTIRNNNGIGWDKMYPKTNMGQVEGLNPRIDEIEAIAKGASKAKVFDTVTELDTWLAVAENRTALQIGDNLLIRATDVPDYWWDGVTKQELEGAKLVLELASSTNNGLMAKDDKAKLDDIEAGATRVTSPGDIGAATSTQGAKADSAYQKPANGIPKTDFESSVQGLLDKADSAVQSLPDATERVMS